MFGQKYRFVSTAVLRTPKCGNRRYSEKSVTIYQSTRLNIPEEFALQNSAILKSECIYSGTYSSIKS